MQRKPLLEALQAYDHRYPGETLTVAHFHQFLSAHEDCFKRTLASPGHVTGSAWIVDPARQSVLLMHHRKLDLWIQLGGHADGDHRVWAVAEREGLEESGLGSLELIAGGYTNSGIPVPFDLDIHEIPARKDEPAHLHFDVRYAFVAPTRAVRGNAESRALAWVPVEGLNTVTEDASVLRMARKWCLRLSGQAAS